MSQTLTISEHLLARLEAAARRRGLNSVEQPPETWQAGEEELTRFQALGERWKGETAHHSYVSPRTHAHHEIDILLERPDIWIAHDKALDQRAAALRTLGSKSQPC